MLLLIFCLKCLYIYTLWTTNKIHAHLYVNKYWWERDVFFFFLESVCDGVMSFKNRNKAEVTVVSGDAGNN